MKPAVTNLNVYFKLSFKTIRSNILLEEGIIHLSDFREVSLTREGVAM